MSPFHLNTWYFNMYPQLLINQTAKCVNLACLLTLCSKSLFYPHPAHSCEVIWYEPKRQSCFSLWLVERCHKASPFICLVITELWNCFQKYTVVATHSRERNCEIIYMQVSRVTWFTRCMYISSRLDRWIESRTLIRSSLELQSMFDVRQINVLSHLYQYVWICSSSLLSVSSWILRKKLCLRMDCVQWKWINTFRDVLAGFSYSVPGQAVYKMQYILKHSTMLGNKHIMKLFPYFHLFFNIIMVLWCYILI